jgi:hypothetical protein
VDLWISDGRAPQVSEIVHLGLDGTEAATRRTMGRTTMSLHLSAAIAVVVLSVGAVWPAHAEVPTAADFAACNKKAAEQSASDAVSVSPRTDLPKDATQLPADARPKPDAAGVHKDQSGPALSSDKDPQIEGLASDRASDKAYVAAYRSCMRQRGF